MFAPVMVPVIPLAAVVVARVALLRDQEPNQELPTILMIVSGLCSLTYWFDLTSAASLPTGSALLVQELLLVSIAYCLGAIGIEGRFRPPVAKVWGITAAGAAAAVVTLHTLGRESVVPAQEWQLTDAPSLILGWIILVLMGAAGTLTIAGYVGTRTFGSRLTLATKLIVTSLGVIGVAWAGLCGAQYARNAPAFSRAYRSEVSDWCAFADTALAASGSIGIAAQLRRGIASGPQRPRIRARRTERDPR